jgi:YHS domain-containing protein
MSFKPVCSQCGKSPVLWQLRYLEVSKAKVWHFCSRSCLKAFLDNPFLVMATEDSKPFVPVSDEEERDLAGSSEESKAGKTKKFSNARDALTWLNSEEAQTCPRRMNEYGPWEHKEGLDHWENRVSYGRQCSFCGGLHPEDAIKWLAYSGTELHTTDKSYKVYLVIMPEKHMFKVYFQHFNSDQARRWNELREKFHLDEDLIERRRLLGSEM